LSPGRPGQRGIYRGWLVVGVASAAAFGSVVFFNPVLGAFVTPLEEEFGGFAAAFAAPAVGWLLDRTGARLVIPPAAGLMVLALLALALMDSLWQLLLFYSVGRALAVGAVSAAAYVAVANWFVRRRAFAVSMVAIGTRIAMALFPLLVATVITLADGNWRVAWVVLAGIILVVGVVPPLLFLHRRPEDLGLLPDGDLAPDPTAEALPVAPVDDDFTLREALRTRAYWLIGLGVALVMFCGGAVNFHQIPHLEDQGLTRTQAAFTVTVFSTLGAIGGLIGGAVATRATVRWTLVGSLIGQAFGILLLINASGVAGAMVYAVTYGVFFGSVVTMEQVVYADYFGRRSLGVIRGSFQPVQMTFNAVGPFAVGLWYERTGSYGAAFAAFAGLFLLAALAMALSAYPRRPAVTSGSLGREDPASTS